MNVETNIATQPNYTAIKAKQKAVWESGDYCRLGQSLQIVGETLSEAMDVRAGQKILDVAAGNGNFSIAAARRWADVTSTDYAEPLLSNGKNRAAADKLDITFQSADAENLPFEDNTFDAVGSTFGVMFVPNQTLAAQEMLRVCRNGGKIAMANWTPTGFFGDVFKLIGQYVPPPTGLKPPVLWGTEAFLHEQFGDVSQYISVTKRNYVFRYRSPAHWIEVFQTYYGPIHKAFEAIKGESKAALTHDLTEILDKFNIADDDTLVMPAEYIEVVITLK